MAERRYVTEKDLVNIKKMANANMSVEDMVQITGFCDRTVRKIRDGQHKLQKEKALKAQEIEQQPAHEYHNGLLMIYSAICDIRDGINALLKEYGVNNKGL